MNNGGEVTITSNVRILMKNHRRDGHRRPTKQELDHSDHQNFKIQVPAVQDQVQDQDRGIQENWVMAVL